jgi:hypothetical protein
VSATVVRRLALLVGASLKRIYPRSQSAWARAMRCEIDQIADDKAALKFALGCLAGGLRAAAGELIPSSNKGATTMHWELGRPRSAGVACALVATCLGLFYLAAAGAPARYLVVNAVAFLLGIVALGGICQSGLPARRSASPLILVLAILLLATSLFGASADGAARWVRVGPLSIQVSLIVLPLMIVSFARRPDALGLGGIAVAAAALAIQPDRAMSGVLALSLAVLAASWPRALPIAALLAAIAAFLVALVRPDAGQAVPYVDRILFTSFEVHAAAGAAVLLGSALLAIPAFVGWRSDPGSGHAWLAFGAAWLGCVLAAGLGNYPTPVVGYGGSAILGYFLSLAFLPAAAAETEGEGDALAGEGADRSPGLPRALQV